MLSKLSSQRIPSLCSGSSAGLYSHVSARLMGTTRPFLQSSGGDACSVTWLSLTWNRSVILNEEILGIPYFFPRVIFLFFLFFTQRPTPGTQASFLPLTCKLQAVPTNCFAACKQLTCQHFLPVTTLTKVNATRINLLWGVLERWPEKKYAA